VDYLFLPEELEKAFCYLEHLSLDHFESTFTF